MPKKVRELKNILRKAGFKESIGKGSQGSDIQACCFVLSDPTYNR